MQTPNFRNKLNLHGTQSLALWLLLSLLSTFSLQAQKKDKNVSAKSRTVHLKGYDDQWMHYGFQIGIFHSSMLMQYTPARSDTVMVQARPGFSLGFITDFSMPNELFSLRIMPNVAFYERYVSYSSPSGAALEDQVYESTVVEIPVMIKYQSRKRKNHRMYAIAGFTAGLEVGGKGGVDLDGLTFRKSNFELSYGVGFDLYWSFFKFAPELRISHGLSNILNYGTDPYSSQLSRLTSHKVALYLNFE